MQTLFNILIVFALSATVLSLGAGLVTFWRGEGEQAAQRSNRFMRSRLLFQALVLLILSLAFFFKA